MKIKAIDILAFGKHKNLHLDFADGFTLFYGANECGKTTLMEFIKMMFYGNVGKSSEIEKNPRKKYRPWNSDIMAGSITFSGKGKNYRLEREFKASNSADKITLIDLDTNEIVALSGKGDIGENFFTLTSGAFERSIFISEPTFTQKNDAADGEINSKLSVLALSNEDDASFEAVLSILKTSKEELLSKSGKIGKLDKAVARLNELENRIKAALEKEKTAEKIKDQIAQKEEELNIAAKESARLFELLKNADKIKKRHFLERYIEAENARLSLKKTLTLSSGEMINEQFFSAADAMQDKISDISSKLSAVEAETQRLEKEISELSVQDTDISDVTAENLRQQLDQTDRSIVELKNKTDSLKNIVENPKTIGKIRLLPIILGTILTLFGSFSIPLIPYHVLSASAAVFGILLLLFGILFKKKLQLQDPCRTKELMEASEELSRLLDSKNSILETISSAEKRQEDALLRRTANEALLKDKSQRLSDLRSQARQLSATLSDLQAEFILFVNKLAPCSNPDEAPDILKIAKTKLTEYEGILQSLSVISANANCNSLEEATEKLAGYPSDDDINLNGEDLENIKEQFKAASDHSGKIRSELAALKTQLIAETDGFESVEVLYRQKRELEKQISDYKAYCDSADLAILALNEAFGELRKNYSGTLDARTAEIFAALTDSKYDKVAVSKNFTITYATEEAFGTKEAGTLSAGTADQLFLALRLAVAELMTETGESLPVFMDDPLANFDDRRAFSALSFLKEYAKNKQVVMFTCHSAFADMARELKINIKDFTE